RYAQSGFVVQAIAMCRLILQIDPQHGETARRLADMTEQQESGRTRIGALAAQQAQVSDEDLVVAQARRAPAPAPARPIAPAPSDAIELDLEPAPSPANEIAELSLEEPEPVIPLSAEDLESVHQLARVAMPTRG